MWKETFAKALVPVTWGVFLAPWVGCRVDWLQYKVFPALLILPMTQVAIRAGYYRAGDF